MERKLQERMVGAGVLILILVIVGPMVLDGGPGPGEDAEQVPGQRPDEIHTQTFRLNEPAPPPARGPAPARPAPEPEPSARPSDSVTSLPPPTPPVTQAEPTAPAPSPTVTAPAAVTPPVRNADASARPAVKTGSDGAGFLVQVGTFGQKSNAERLAASLKGRGFEAFVSPVTGGGRTLYRVRVGPPGAREAATSLAGRLAAAGQSGQVVSQ